MVSFKKHPLRYLRHWFQVHIYPRNIQQWHLKRYGPTMGFAARMQDYRETVIASQRSAHEFLPGLTVNGFDPEELLAFVSGYANTSWEAMFSGREASLLLSKFGHADFYRFYLFNYKRELIEFGELTRDHDPRRTPDGALVLLGHETFVLR